MTRSRTPRTQAPPLADTLRSALAQGWHSLATLDALAGGTVSTRRARVHAALAELAAAGVAREERYSKGVAEVRLAPVTLPAPMPDDGDDGLDAEDREAARVAVEEEADGAAYSDAIPPLSPEAMAVFVDLVEHPPSPTEALRALYAGPPGPSSRCAVCDATYVKHESLKAGHAFTPKPRGRPRVAPIPDAAPAVLPRARQRAKRGPVVDVDGGRVEREPCPPCIDCGEEPGSCPEGRCRDCDMDHVCASGSCRECFVWIVREEVAGPLAAQHRSGCSLATAEDWHPRDAADVARVRARREEPEALSTDARAVYDAIKAACPTRAVLADGGTPNASAEPVHVAELDAAEELRRLLPHTRCPSVWHDVQCARESGHPCEDGRHHSAADWKDGIWTDEAAERWAQRAEKDPPPKPRRMRARVEGGTIVSYREPPPCRPPACHRDDIHEPSRVRGFARPLCEAHRRWVEAAGGTVEPCAHQWDDRPHYRKCMYCGVEQARAGETV